MIWCVLVSGGACSKRCDMVCAGFRQYVQHAARDVIWCVLVSGGVCSMQQEM